MSVRIIAGDYKGRRLETPPGLHTRPLLDRIKQSLFDYLGQYLDGLRVADVCAGSGSFGFEAASRHAEQVYFFENDKTALNCLEKNRVLLQSDHCHIKKGNFQQQLPTVEPLDLIYADPPFPWYKDDPDQLSELILLCLNQLKPDGRFLIRGDKGYQIPSLPNTAKIVSTKTYGRSWIVEIQHTH